MTGGVCTVTLIQAGFACVASGMETDAMVCYTNRWIDLCERNAVK